MKNKLVNLMKVIVAFTMCIVSLSGIAACSDGSLNTQTEFLFMKNEECYSKYVLYFSENGEITFSIPVFANTFVEKNSEDQISLVSFDGTDVSDISITAELNWMSSDDNFNYIYVFECTIAARNNWDSTVAERKITALEFSYGNAKAKFAVDVRLLSCVSELNELIDDTSIAKDNTTYEEQHEFDWNGKNMSPYAMSFQWDCASWGASGLFDYSESAYMRSAYFENSMFNLNNFTLFYKPIDSLEKVEYKIENTQEFKYKLSPTTDSLTFDIEVNSDMSKYLFMGDNLVLNIEYNGKVHKIIVGNIQLHCRNSALETIFK